MENNKSEVRKLTAYLPQYNALFDELTGAQMLEIMGLMRGYRRGDTDRMVGKMAADMDFTNNLNDRIENYSSGNKRKLSTAIALMGNPAVVYLGAYSI